MDFSSTSKAERHNLLTCARMKKAPYHSFTLQLKLMLTEISRPLEDHKNPHLPIEMVFVMSSEKVLFLHYSISKY